MSKGILVVVLAATVLLLRAGAYSAPEMWAATYHLPASAEDSGRAAVVDSSGNLYVTGGSNTDYITIKYNEAGEQQWLARYPAYQSPATEVGVDGSGNVLIAASPATVVKYDPDGHRLWGQSYNTGSNAPTCSDFTVTSSGDSYLLLTGRSTSSRTDNDLVIIKLDPAGNVVWTQAYGTTYSDAAVAIATDASGNVYVVGECQTGRLDSYSSVAKYSLAGQLLWAHTLSTVTAVAAMVVDPAGNVCVAGGSLTGSDMDYVTVKLNAAGDELWSRVCKIGTSYDMCSAIALDPQGNVFVTGTSSGGTCSTLCYDAAGNQLWLSTYSASDAHCDTSSIAIAPSGSVIVAGYASSTATQKDYLAISYDHSGNLQWSKQYNGPASGADTAYGLAVSQNGSVYITGSSTGSGTGADFVTLKYDAAGNQSWCQRFDGPGSASERVNAMAIDPAGNIVVTGISRAKDIGDIVTVKYDPAGQELWSKVYNGPASSYESPSAIAVDQAGNIYVTGRSAASANFYDDYVTIKYDPSGSELWVRRYNGTAPNGGGYDWAYGIAVDAQGNVYVTGFSAGAGTGNDCTTIKYDSAGNQVWVNRYDGPAHAGDYGAAIAVDSEGNICVVGSSQGLSAGDLLAIKYDPAGNALWTTRYPGPVAGSAGATCIAMLPGGGFYAVGSISPTTTNPDYLTLKLDAQGNVLWHKTYAGPGSGADTVNALALCPDGGVCVTGSSKGVGTGADCETIRYSASGDELWSARLSAKGSSDDVGAAIVVDSSSCVYVAGYTPTSRQYIDCAVIKYDQSGQQMWLATYNGSRNYDDRLCTIALDPAGYVVAAGFTTDAASVEDFLVLKYDGVAPTGTVVINDGAESTTTMGVTLALSATDEATGVAQMRFSNDGINWSEWESYAATKAWTLAAPDGLKTVYVQFRDGMGNISTAVTDTITMTATPPELVSASVSPAMAAFGDTLHVSVSASDAVHGIASVAADGVALANTSGSIWEGDITAASGLGAHTVTIGAVDGLGNVTSASAGYRTAGIVGIAGDCLSDPVMAAASSRWLFKLWGRVRIIDNSHIDIDYGAIREDESIPLLHVFSPGYSGITDDDYVWVRGVLDPATATITARPEHVVKQNE